MRTGIPTFRNRVAPRCTSAAELLVVTSRPGRIERLETAHFAGEDWDEFLTLLVELNVETVICGGISRAQKNALGEKGIAVIENVACTVQEALVAIERERMRPGYGFGPVEDEGDAVGESGDGDRGADPTGDRDATPDQEPAAAADIDCLACWDEVCLQGRRCRYQVDEPPAVEAETRNMLESARDITFERERTLCRLSEVIYFGLEMHYRRIGVAYCADLAEPAAILVGVLRRYFEVVPVCCKIGGLTEEGPELFTGSAGVRPEKKVIACNPLGQAQALNAAACDLNVLVGLCVGVDCVFVKASEAPVTTLFVKDKSLANNPIGALYSEYYLSEAARTAISRT